jgi:hypothetical protein
MMPATDNTSTEPDGDRMSVTAFDSPAGGPTTTRNGPRRPSAHDGLRRELDAQRYAEICGRCAATIPTDAPVALQHPCYTAGRRRRVTTCLSCAARWLAEYRPPQEACPHCHRPVYRREPRGRLFCCDRCAWLAASARRRAKTARREKTCAACGRSFTATRVDARTCSPACRQKDYRCRFGSG